jgi:transcriptional regulator with XRE-family HTH domain
VEEDAVKPQLDRELSRGVRSGWAQGGPTALRIALGGHLRRLREASGITRKTAGRIIRASSSKISRLELGRVASKERDVADLLTLYGVTDAEERQRLLNLARQANVPGWWRKYGDVLPSWFDTYLGLEQAASVIRVYHPQLVPGLLQRRIMPARRCKPAMCMCRAVKSSVEWRCAWPVKHS